MPLLRVATCERLPFSLAQAFTPAERKVFPFFLQPLQGRECEPVRQPSPLKGLNAKGKKQ
jgi:hypothetical protein